MWCYHSCAYQLSASCVRLAWVILSHWTRALISSPSAIADRASLIICSNSEPASLACSVSGSYNFAAKYDYYLALLSRQRCAGALLVVVKLLCEIIDGDFCIRTRLALCLVHVALLAYVRAYVAYFSLPCVHLSFVLRVDLLKIDVVLLKRYGTSQTQWARSGATSCTFVSSLRCICTAVIRCVGARSRCTVAVHSVYIINSSLSFIASSSRRVKAPNYTCR